MGFEEVYDYAPGKVDWFARGLPADGDRAGEPRSIDFAGMDAVICALEDPIGPLRDQVQHSPYGFALVLAAEGVLLGRIPHDAFQGDLMLRAEQVMRPGPQTHRPNVAPDKLLAKLEDKDLTAAILTDPDGRLLGVVVRGELERQVHAGRPSPT